MVGEKMTRIFIPGEFQTLNDHERASRSHWSAGAKSKKIDTLRTQYDQAVQDTVPVTAYPVRITFIWYRKNKRSDLDNIAFAKKSILDGLVLAGVLAGDGWKFVREDADVYELDANNPGVEVVIETLR